MQPRELVKILLDATASISERDDAAMDLSVYDSKDVLNALLKVGSDEDTDNIILSSVGESLAEIWLRNKSFNSQQYLNLCEETRYSVKENMADKFPSGLA